MKFHLDLHALMRDARRFWSWWTGELRACIPAKLQDRLTGARTDIRPGREGVDILCRDGAQERRYREDKPLASFGAEDWSELAGFIADRSARIILATRDAYCFKLDLPRRTGRNLPSTIALQMEFASPLEPSHAAWSWAVLDVTRETVTVLVAEAKASLLDRMEQLFLAQGLPLPPVFCETEAGLICVRDGVRRFRSEEGRRNQRAMRIAFALVAVTPVLLLVSAHVLIARNEAKLNLVRDEIAPKIDADRQARREARIWQAWEPLGLLPPASIILGDLGSRVPEGGSIEKLDVVNGRQISFDLAGLPSDTAAEAMVSSDGLLLISGPLEPDVQGSTFAMRAEMP